MSETKVVAKQTWLDEVTTEKHVEPRCDQKKKLVFVAPGLMRFFYAR